MHYGIQEFLNFENIEGKRITATEICKENTELALGRMTKKGVDLYNRLANMPLGVGDRTKGVKGRGLVDKNGWYADPEKMIERLTKEIGPYYGEPKTEDLLYEITGERERRIETMIRPRKVTIEASDGKTYAGVVQRVEICPMNVHNVVAEVLLTDREVGDYGIKRVIFDNPSTIVYWSDGTKTVVTCQDNIQPVGKTANDEKSYREKPMAAGTYSRETGLALCFAKKMLGNKGNYNDIFRKFIEEDKTAETAGKGDESE